MTACVWFDVLVQRDAACGAPISAATFVSTVEAEVPPAFSHARTPRVAQDSAYLRTLSYTPRGNLRRASC